MKILFLLSVLVFWLVTNSCSNKSLNLKPNPLNTTSDIIIRPVFQGGDSLFNIFVEKNLVIPKDVFEKKIDDEIWIRFFILKDSTVKNTKIFKSIKNCKECSKEAIRIISISPKWSPAYEIDSFGKKIRSLNKEVIETIHFHY